MSDQAAVEEKVENQTDAQTPVQSAEFSEATGSETNSENTSIDFLLDMNVPVTVTIGKTEMPIQKLLKMGPGSVLQLDKPIDQPADLYLRDTKFATGHIVVVDDKFAVKIKEIIKNTA
jgi:flagellar motor switch protein FliN/FliY